jgi:hypothetical protein
MRTSSQRVRARVPASAAVSQRQRPERRYDLIVGFSFAAPLLVVEDVLLGARGIILLPAVPREGLPLCAGDLVDLVHDEDREEVEVLALDPDHDPTRVRLRIAARVHVAPGFEVWASQVQSHVMMKRPPAIAGQVVSLAGCVSRGRR